MTRRGLMGAALLAAASVGSRAEAAVIPVTGDPVLYWNDVLLDAVRLGRTPPPVASRAMALMNVAVADAVIAANGRRTESYLGPVSVAWGGDARAAASRAARDVLVDLFPAQAATFDAALASSLALVAEGSRKTKGATIGSQVAAAALASRAADGADVIKPYTPGSGIGDWRPTPPAFGAALLPNWPDVTPWAMTSGDQFRPDAPPAVGTPEYRAAYERVKMLGSATSSVRTDDQTNLALYWADGAGTVTPPGHWIAIAIDVAGSQGLSTEDNARLFGRLSLALADAAIVSWDAKYQFNTWRPITAIQLGDADGDPLTQGDPDWTPLLTTPPFPGYTSGHATFSSAAATVLASIFGDDTAFCSPQDGTPIPITRCFDSFSAAALEAADSRIFGGIHFDFDGSAGVSSGRALGDLVAANFFLATPAPSALALFGLGALALAAARRRGQAGTSASS